MCKININFSVFQKLNKTAKQMGLKPQVPHAPGPGASIGKRELISSALGGNGGVTHGAPSSTSGPFKEFLEKLYFLCGKWFLTSGGWKKTTAL